MFTIRDPDKFQKIAAGFQSWILAIAVLVGGGWTLFTFNSLLQIENSQAQLIKLTREIEETRRPELNLDVTPLATQDSTKRHFFEARIQLKNVGNKSTVLEFTKPPITIYRVRFSLDGQPMLSRMRSLNIPINESSGLRCWIADSGTLKHLNVVFYVDEAGIYLVRFEAKRQTPEIEEAIHNGAVSNKNKIYWATDRYFSIK